jgi:hypothetical protein
LPLVEVHHAVFHPNLMLIVPVPIDFGVEIVAVEPLRAGVEIVA